MELGEAVESDSTGVVTGCDTGRVVAKFSHVAEAEGFVEMIDGIINNAQIAQDDDEHAQNRFT